MRPKPQIFISYARADGSAHRQRLYNALTKAGYNCWWDDNINPAEDFGSEIEEAIEASALVLVLATADLKRDDSFVRKEIAYAQSCNIPIIPLKFQNGHLPITIKTLTYMDFADWDKGMQALYKKLEAMFGKPLAALSKNTDDSVILLPEASTPIWRKRLVQILLAILTLIIIPIVVNVVSNWLSEEPEETPTIVAETETDEPAQVSSLLTEAPDTTSTEPISSSPAASLSPEISNTPLTGLIPAGDYSLNGESINLASYRLDLNEVNRAEFMAFLERHDFDTNRQSHLETIAREDQNYPMLDILPEEAQAYCQDKGGRLPGLHEWLVAAALQSNGTLDFSLQGAYAPVFRASNPRLQSVGSLQANPLGYYNMLGNAAEWVTGENGRYYTAGGNFGSGLRDSILDYNVIVDEPEEADLRFVGFRCRYSG